MTRRDLRPRRRLVPAERRDAIFTAAQEAFWAAPYAAVSLAAVGRAAGASEALVYRYFGSKAELYAAVVTRDVEGLCAERAATQAALAPGTPARERIRANLEVHVDYVASHSAVWAAALGGGVEPAEAVAVRRRAREAELEEVAGLLNPGGTMRHDYALWGFFGFLDEALRRWLAAGCPADQRSHLVFACLGALEGALGDWAA
jgi:AcrR family transcriptional regulator